MKIEYPRPNAGLTLILKMPPKIWIPLVKLRASNHKLPKDIHSWNILYREKTKGLSWLPNLNEVGDEYHYIMICPIFKEAREEFLSKYYFTKPSVYKYIELVNSWNHIILLYLGYQSFWIFCFPFLNSNWTFQSLTPNIWLKKFYHR